MSINGNDLSNTADTFIPPTRYLVSGGPVLLFFSIGRMLDGVICYKSNISQDNECNGFSL